MTRKKCRKLLMSANVTKREAEEYMDNLLPECGSYERLYISTIIYCFLKNECTATEQSRAERYIDVILIMLGGETDLGSGYVLGGDKEGRASYMEGAYSRIDKASVVIFLPGWEKHKELQMQHMYCKYIGKRIMYFKLTAKGAALTLPRSKKYKKERKTCRTWKRKS